MCNYSFFDAILIRICGQMPKNTLIRPSCKNSGKNRGNKTQKNLKTWFFSTSKNQLFGTYLSKTMTPICLKLGEIVPWVQAFKSGAGISFILLFRIFKAEKPQKMAFLPLIRSTKMAIKIEKSKKFKIAAPNLVCKISYLILNIKPTLEKNVMQDVCRVGTERWFRDIYI